MKEELVTFPVFDFPKIKCPFKRMMTDGRYLATPEIEPGYEWVFTDPTTRAVDKLHGTNICVCIDNGVIKHIDNRTTRVMERPVISLYAPIIQSRFLTGVINSIHKGWLPVISTGRIYGELIAPEINGNLHEVDRPYFVPFEFLYERHFWKSWSQNKYPKDFDSISEWFKELPSLFSKVRVGKDVLAEGLIFRNEEGKMAKLRRDMFEWYYEDSDLWR